MNNFLDNYIPDRIRIMKESPDPSQVHAVLLKHLPLTLSEIVNKYKVSINKFRQEITIESDFEGMSLILSMIDRTAVKPISITQLKVMFDIDEFLKRVY